MNYSQKGTVKKKKQGKSKKSKLMKKAGVSFFRTFIVCCFICLIVGCFAGVGVIRGIIDGAPSIDDINVAPTGFATTLYYSDGSEIQNLVGSDANRVYATLDEIPKDVQNAFIAIEDERFWTHNGIDVKGIVRAFFNGISKGEFDQGASTLTQQLLKNQVFGGGSEPTFAAKLKRKLQEWYLAVQLEEKLEKDEILEYYLNTINLGQNTLGVRSASLRYFDKDVSELSLSEATVIAGITQSPSYLNPISYPEDNAAKRKIILKYMEEQGYITKAEHEEALADDVYSRIQTVNEEQYADSSNINSYFVDELIDHIIIDLQEKAGYSETQAFNLLYRGGLQIHTTQNKKIQDVCDEVFANESLYPSNSEWELTYRLSVMHEDKSQSHYSEQHLKKYFREEKGVTLSLYYNEKGAADAYVEEFRASVLGPNDTIAGEVINYTLQPQVSFVVMNQENGKVLAMIGGRGEKTGNRTLNRATDSPRQPGSTFKIVSTYLPALDTKGMTLATVQDDTKFTYPGSGKQVNNWDKSGYKGFTTLRQGIYDSMNVLAVKTMVDITPQIAYDYLMRLGFTTIYDKYVTPSGEIYTDIQYPTALGGLTVGVTNYELTAAFAAIANHGVYTEPVMYTKIIDHKGKVLIENEPDTRQVMKETTAWLLTDAMRDVITKGTGGRLRFNEISMPVAGKTGTTSNDIDLWFVGYTPYYTAGIWGGYDNNKDQSNTSYHKDLWRTAMQKIHQVMDKEYTDFQRPAGITSATICTKSGKLAVEGLCNATKRSEYFDSTTVPKEKCDVHVKYMICTESEELAGEFCPEDLVEEKIFLLKEEAEGVTTADTPFVIAPDTLTNEFKETCHLHVEEELPPELPEDIEIDINTDTNTNINPNTESNSGTNNNADSSNNQTNVEILPPTTDSSTPTPPDDITPPSDTTSPEVPSVPEEEDSIVPVG